jgi:thiol-disulfide isomerase/thioredoxin
MPRAFPTLLSILLLSCQFPSPAAQADELAPEDPFWTLIHDQAVLNDLKLTADERQAWQAALDPLDLRCFPLRNRPASEAEKGFAPILAEARSQLGKILKPPQVQRLEQIVVRSQGPAALLRDDLASRLKLADKQRADIRKAITAARDARQKLQSDLRAARLETAAAEKELNKLNTTERDAVNAVLTAEQKQLLAGLLARDFDVTKLGRTRFKTPDLAGDRAAWLNSPPLTPAALRGRVVVVHFFAFGCSNCIHNYPTYREWQQELAGTGVQLIGIHTPETPGEHNVETLKARLTAERLEFPVLVDNDRANWTAFGNSMWPSVYVIDKRGYLRAFWAGELKWQGATGDAQLRKTIESLLREEH